MTKPRQSPPPPKTMSPAALRAELASRGIQTTHHDRPALERAVLNARRNSPGEYEHEFGTPASLPRKDVEEVYAHARGAWPPPPPLHTNKASVPQSALGVLPPSVLRTIAASSDPALTSVDVSHRPLSEDSLVRLLDALENNTTVTKLNLSSCSLNDAASHRIGDLVSKNCTLITLNLDDNAIGVEGAASLSTALITNEVLRSLTLNRNPLGDRGLIYLAKAMGHNNTLTTLEMNECGITQVGRLEELQSMLVKRRIDSNFESLLERLMDDDYRVTGIDLSGRPLGDGGIHRLSQALSDNTSVRQLWLRDCSVTNVGAKALASCLEQNMSIVDLFLGGNEIGDEGLGYICDALRGSNCTLVSLEMDDNRITEKGVRDFISALDKNSSVLVASFENNVEDAECLRHLDIVLEEKRKGLNLVSFVVDPEDESDDEEGDRSGIVNMSVCSSYMPSTYRRAGFRSVASTKYSRLRNSTSNLSTGSHMFSIYNKTARQKSSFHKPTPPTVSASGAAVQQHPPPPPPSPRQRHSPPNVRSSPPERHYSPPQPPLNSSDHNLSGSDLSGKRSSRSAKTPNSTNNPLPPAPNSQESQPLRSSPPAARNGNAPARNHAPPSSLPMQPQGSMAQAQHHVALRRTSSESSGRSSKIPSRSHDPPGDGANLSALAHPRVGNPQVLETVDSESHKSKNSKYSSGKDANALPLVHRFPYLPPVLEGPSEHSLEKSSTSLLSEKSYSETSKHYDQTLKTLCRRVEMLRLMNYFTATHYRSRQFWFWFLPISLCIFLCGILSLASAVDMVGLAPLILSLCTAFLALVAFVLNFLQTRLGWSSLAQSHRLTSLELAQVGCKLEQLRKFEGGRLSSMSISSRSRAHAVRDVYRIDLYISALQKCTPDIPIPIDHAFHLLVSRMKSFCQKYPNAIKARLTAYDQETTIIDPEDPVPLEMQLDAFDLLCQEISSYALFPLFLPNPQKTAGKTVNIFFAKPASKATQQKSRRISTDSYDSRRDSSYDSRGEARSDDMYDESYDVV
ncbi:hypothetical protein HJC23_008516 [Cyclotella cryptica]|uniref:Uncharacterized protein n=1 Tax=Cyclotella cryptica TaxID=29204 RepID=A0ABD3R020_9STRA